ncbi:MAG: hypothetical protein IJU44_06415, partial [Kiritimatiellae bacterium]|nr:hypothetical protein [Kiritimatiellia bacterium]
NGKTFDGKALIVVDGGTLLIEDGTFTATGEGSDGMYGVYVLKGGTATFGVAADGEDAAYGPTISSWFAAIGSNNTTAPAAITVYGGSYTANVTPASSDWWSYFCAPVYAAANGSYNLQGGTFKGYYGLLSSRYENTQQNISIGSAVDINSTSDTDIFVDSKTGTAQEGEVTRTIASETNDRTLPAGYTWASDDNGVYVVAEAVASVTTGSGESATTKYFATLKEAIAAAVSGDKVELLSDVTVGSTIEIIKSITIDGGEHTLTSGATRGIWIDAGDVNVTIKNLTVLAANTNTGFERAIQVNPDLDNVTLNIDNVTATSTAYCVNVCAGVDDLVLNITNSELTGWAALNLYGSGLTVNVSDSKLVGVNDKSYSSWNTFGVIVLEGDTTGNTTLHSSDYTVSIVDSEIVVDTTEQGNYQYAIIHNKQSESNVLKLDGCEITFGNDHCLFFNDASTGSVTMLKDTVASDTEQIPELSLYYVYVEGTGDYSGYTVIANTAALVVTEGENEDYEYTPYATLAEAVENAEDGGDVVLMANNTETVTVAKNLTIHKNGTSYTATRLTASPAFVSEETEDAYIFSSAKVTLTVGNVSTGYATLQAAVDAIGRGTAEATASGTIELLDNIVLTEPVRIPSTGNAAGAYVAVTINGNGKKISGVFDDSFNSFFSGLSSALADNVSLTVNNTAFQNTNANPESNWVKGFVATTEGTGTPTTDLHLAFNECTFTNFYTPVCVNPGTVAGDFTGRSLSITGCTYDNVNYGYSVDTSTEYNGSGYALAADKQIKITFTNNTGYDAVREMFEVAQVGDFVYKTFVKAATDAVANGGTLEILADLGENNEFTLPEGGALTVKVTDFEYAINPADGYTVASIKTVSDLDAATVTYSYITPVAQITRDGVTTKYPTLADAAADADDNDVIEIIGDYGTEELPAGWILDGANNRLFRAAAAIGDDLYPTVQEAFDDAVAGETVVLLKDSAPEDKALYVDVACTLDLNGHTLTAVILPNFDFTVVDTYEDDEGGANLGSIKLPVLAENGNIEGDTELDGAIWAWEGATVTVAGGTYDNPAVVLWTEGANVVIDGGVFETYAVVPDAETCAAATRKNRWDVEATVTVTDGEFNGNYLLGTHQYAKGATLNIEGGWFKAKDASVAQTIDSGTVTVSGGFFADEPVFVDEDHVSADNQDDETKAVYPYTVAAVVRTATITSVLVNDTTGTANITVALENWKSGTAVKLWAKVDYNDAYWAQVDEKTGTGEEITFLNVPVSFNTVYTATGESVTSGAFDRGANVVGALAVTLSSSEDCVIGVPYSEIGEFDTITVAQLFQNTTLQDGDTVYTLSNEYVWNASSREWEADDEDNIDQLAPGSAVVFYRKGGGTVRISGEVKAWTEKQPWEEDEVAWANSLDSDDGWNMAASVNPTALNVQDIPYVGLGDDDSLWITDSTGVFRELKWDGSQWYYSKKVYAGWDVTVTKVTDLTIEAGSAFWYVNND